LTSNSLFRYKRLKSIEVKGVIGKIKNKRVSMTEEVMKRRGNVFPTNIFSNVAFLHLIKNK
jgi:hypothetical protein